MRPRLSILALAALSIPTPARAWHKEGHMAVARIAWQQMDDLQRKQLTAILDVHPHRDTFLLTERPSQTKADEWMFVRAATWPDWVKSPYGPGIDPAKARAISKVYDKRAWHFVNLPYVHQAEADRFDEADLRKKVLEPEYDDAGQPRHAVAALKRCLKQLRDPDTSATDRAVALCWVLHLVGDLHQPLHAVALIASKAEVGPQEFPPPQGDEGGNRLAVRVREEDDFAIELHTVWDSLQFRDEPKYPDVEVKALGWVKDPALGRGAFQAELAKAEFLDWADESRELAKSVAYRWKEGLLEATPLPPSHKRDDLKGLPAKPLPEGYLTAAEGVARKRLVLGGYRLGDQLALVVKGEPKD